MRRARRLSLALFLVTLAPLFAFADGKSPPRAPSKPAAPPYAAFVRSWHAPTDGGAAPVDASGRPMLALYALNTSERLVIDPLSDAGGFAAHDLDRAAHLLRDPGAGNEHPVEPRTLDAVYKIQAHFHAEEVRVISGYRTPRPGGGSNHGKGRAIDIVVPGASDDDVAKFAREMGFMGVGVYPVSGFVHVDVRDRSYFWVDSSAPGRRNRERGVLADLAARADAAALARGDKGVAPLVVAPDVDAVIRAQVTASTPSAMPADEDDDIPP